MTCQNLHQESLNNLAVCFSQTGDQDLALSHFTECLEIMRKVFFFGLIRPEALAFIWHSLTILRSCKVFCARKVSFATTLDFG